MLFKVTFNNEDRGNIIHLVWVKEAARLSLIGLDGLATATRVYAEKTTIDEFLWPRYRRCFDMVGYGVNSTVLDDLQRVLDDRRTLQYAVAKIVAAGETDETIQLTSVKED